LDLGRRSAVTHTTDRATLVGRAIRATLTGDSSVVATLFSADVHGTLPSSVTCAAELAVEIEDRSGVFADVALEIISTEIHEDRIWVEWSATVTHAGALVVDDMLIPPTRRRGEVRGITVADFVADRIADFRQYWDYSGLLHEQEPR
jgi:hypothetical protein